MVEIERLKRMPEFQAMEEKELKELIAAMQELVHSYTNNNFQNRQKRITAKSENGKIIGFCQFFDEGDSIQISESINNGLYTIVEVTDRTITLDRALYEAPYNLLTKIEYPKNVIQGVVNLLKWEVQMRNKVGIQSESISRHAVTYFSQDVTNTCMGYPISLLGFLKPYKKAKV